MRTKNLLLVLALIVFAAPLSMNGEERHPKRPVVSGVVQSVDVDGDNVIIHLYREPYNVLTVKWMRVRTSDDHELYAPDLRNQDNVEIEGDFDLHNTVLTVHRIKLVSRTEHLGTMSF